MPDSHGMNPSRSLADALRALPDAAPQADLWPQLAQSLAQRRRARAWRVALPAALAAGVALALLLPRVAERDAPIVASMPAATPTPTQDTSTTTAAATTNDVDTLRRRSHSLETWIAAVSAQSPQNGRDLMAAVEVEDLIGVVDVQLDATRNDAEALPLWKRRVDLLEDLATIRGAAALSVKGDARVAALQAI